MGGLDDACGQVEASSLLSGSGKQGGAKCLAFPSRPGLRGPANPDPNTAGDRHLILQKRHPIDGR
jgi:hypothetical protein